MLEWRRAYLVFLVTEPFGAIGNVKVAKGGEVKHRREVEQRSGNEFLVEVEGRCRFVVAALQDRVA